MVELQSYRKDYQFTTGEYIRGGFRTLAQETIRERGRFEPEFGFADFQRFGECMLRILPVAQDEILISGLIAEPEADKPLGFINRSKVFGEWEGPTITIKSQVEGEPNRHISYDHREKTGYVALGSQKDGPRQNVTWSEMREFCAEAYNLFEQSVTPQAPAQL